MAEIGHTLLASMQYLKLWPQRMNIQTDVYLHLPSTVGLDASEYTDPSNWIAMIGPKSDGKAIGTTAGDYA